jgi:hypothetical protein
MNKYYRVEIVFTGLLNMVSGNTYTHYAASRPESTTEHAPMKDTHNAYFTDPVEAEEYRQTTMSSVVHA